MKEPVALRGTLHFPRTEGGLPGARKLTSTDELVDKIFEVFLATRGERRRILRQRYLLELGERGLAPLNFETERRVPRGVSRPDEVRNASVGPYRSRHFQAPGECVHPPDVRVEQILWRVRLAAALGVEIESPEP